MDDYQWFLSTSANCETKQETEPMASIPITIVSIGHILYAFFVSLSIFLISSSNKVFAVGGGQTFHTIQVTSLLPSSVCSPSTKG
ncbi:hypothetical protein RHSIM_Rhsim02G0218700 [Rhododendron simsii]|uniref:Uncharacterized protein n=1 Tax=Rhododendron simsii TaxID=118357 RepID=A0A834H8U9_RHOSS|nr:hypothetical protein RHSIM_Rhsim02G0218700 [Rhododendron simsii]